jgi:hypothetical protein
MKSFYAGLVVADGAAVAPEADVGVTSAPLYIGTRARVAVYDTISAAPYVEDIAPAPALEYIERLSARVYELARQRGGSVPYTIIREIAENLIHAGFAEPVVSILDEGRTIRFSDQGPGIPDKRRAVQPGFTTASTMMKSVIRGVGSGLPIVNDFLSVTGGSLSIEDNLSGGCVITVSGRADSALPEVAEPPAALGIEQEQLLSEGLPEPAPVQLSVPVGLRLTSRQKHVLALVLESGSAGPSLVSKELGVGLSTAYRDLAALEDLGLIESSAGKRRLTAEGIAFLGAASSSTA